MTNSKAEFEYFVSWAVYDHPNDYPDAYVARRFENENPTSTIMVCPELDRIRQQLFDMGLIKIERFQGDDPKILECWI